MALVIKNFFQVRSNKPFLNIQKPIKSLNDLVIIDRVLGGETTKKNKKKNIQKTIPNIFFVVATIESELFNFRNKPVLFVILTRQVYNRFQDLGNRSIVLGVGANSP